MNFYQKNNFYLTDYLSIEDNGNFNIMSANILTNNNTFELDNYIELDKKISEWYFSKKSKIKGK